MRAVSDGKQAMQLEWYDLVWCNFWCYWEWKTFSHYFPSHTSFVAQHLRPLQLVTVRATKCCDLWWKAGIYRWKLIKCDIWENLSTCLEETGSVARFISVVWLLLLCYCWWSESSWLENGWWDSRLQIRFGTTSFILKTVLRWNCRRFCTRRHQEEQKPHHQRQCHKTYEKWWEPKAEHEKIDCNFFADLFAYFLRLSLPSARCWLVSVGGYTIKICKMCCEIKKSSEND